MKRKRYIAYVLFIISMAMLMIPVVPHHHHADGLICMKSDMAADECGHQHPDSCNKHCCCNTGCATTHFVQQIPASDNDTWASPTATWVVTLFCEPIYQSLLLPENHIRRQEFVYREALHGTFTVRATGLRAPPSVLA